MKNRVVYFRIKEATIMVFINAEKDSFDVTAWESFSKPIQKLTKWLPLTAYSKIINVIIKHGGVFDEMITID